MAVDAAAQLAIAGTIDGANAVFTIPASSGLLYQIYKNGVLQDPNTMYMLVGNTITFLDPFVPQVGDILLVYGY